MDMNKFYEYFQPDKVKDRIHIIGCGAVGSTIAELLVRMGLTKFTLYDFDIVEPHNIANQMYRHSDIGKKKTDALSGIMREINPDVDIRVKEKYEPGMNFSGHVFLCVDKISIRRQFVEENVNNPSIKTVFDCRIRLTDAQSYAADWSKYDHRQNLLNSMQFSDEEADAETPVSACNMTLSVAPTVRQICNYAVSNFINLLNGKELKKVILIDAFEHNLMTF